MTKIGAFDPDAFAAFSFATSLPGSLTSLSSSVIDWTVARAGSITTSRTWPSPRIGEP